MTCHMMGCSLCPRALFLQPWSHQYCRLVSTYNQGVKLMEDTEESSNAFLQQIILTHIATKCKIIWATYGIPDQYNLHACMLSTVFHTWHTVWYLLIQNYTLKCCNVYHDFLDVASYMLQQIKILPYKALYEPVSVIYIRCYC